MNAITGLAARVSRRWLVIGGGIAIVVALALVGLAQVRGATPAPTTVAVSRGPVVATVAGSGTIAAARTVTLPFQAVGAVAEIYVEEGDMVAAGQALARLDARSLEAKVAAAAAALASAQAQLAQAEEGDATSEEVAAAQAGLANAVAQLERVRTGNVTPADLANAEASVRSAEAKLRSTVAGPTKPEDIANAEAALRSAEAKLRSTIAGVTKPEDITNAEAAMRSAEARLADVRAGSRPADIDAATQRVSQARDNRAKQASQLSNAKEQARLTMEQAANDLRKAQHQYGAAKLIWEEADRTGKDPNIPEQPNGAKGYRDLTDAKRRQYKADFESAELAMQNAGQALEQRRLAYEDAKTQEITGLQTTDSQVLEAQANLDKLLAGATQGEVDQAQAAVDQARAQLDKLRRPTEADDIAQARAAVDQARAQLDKLRRPADANDVAAAQATVDQAKASLEKQRQGGTAADIAAAQATVDQAKANLDKLTARSAASTLRVRQAAVTQAEATLQQARLDLDQTILRAPFGGTVTDVTVVLGSIVERTTPVISLIDRSTLHIDLTLSENDVARVTLSQPVDVTIDAVPDWRTGGEVAYIAPAAETRNNVVTYAVRVRVLDADQRVKVGMTANLDITVARKDAVLLVPNASLLPKGAGRVVQLPGANGQPAIEREVRTGLTDGTMTEIVDGLVEGDAVLAAPGVTPVARGSLLAPR